MSSTKFFSTNNFSNSVIKDNRIYGNYKKGIFISGGDNLSVSNNNIKINPKSKKILNLNTNNNNFNINNRPYSNIEYLSNFTNYNLFNFMRHNNNKNKDINNKNIPSKRKNTMNNKKKQNITIKNAVININMFNMFEPKLFLSSYNNQHHKSQSKPHSIINSMPNSNINRQYNTNPVGVV